MGTCPKCGYDEVRGFWHQACTHGHSWGNCECHRAAQERPVDEHLHFTCRCGFDWTEPPLDQRVSEPAVGA